MVSYGRSGESSKELGVKQQGKPIVELEHVDKWFGNTQVLTDFTLSVRQGEKVVIIGPSGSGKSTAIRLVNGLESHEAGRVRVDGMDVTAHLKDLVKIRRKVGMVFQQFNLFPHLSVLGNLMAAPSGVLPANRRRSWRSTIWIGSMSRSRRRSILHSCPADSSSASPSRARFVCSPR
jgi:ABC-type Fe3+/spermidine/putrescine transport system ATPase subunit